MSETGEPVAAPSVAPGDLPVSEEMAPGEQPTDPDDLGIPYDPTASDEENRARAEKMAEEAAGAEMEEEMQDE